MTSGIRRKVDDLGRVVIPAGIRRSLGIREGDALEVSVQGDEVVLSRPVNQCVFCHSDQELHTFRNRAICASCATGIGMIHTDTPATAGSDETTPGVLPAKPDVGASERRAVAAHEGGLRVVRGEVTTPVPRQELPASTTAW